MRKNFQRAVSFILAVVMVFTMSNWSSFVTTVAKAAEGDTTVYIYETDYDNVGLAYEISGLVGETALLATPLNQEEYPNWYSVEIPSDATSIQIMKVKEDDTKDSGYSWDGGEHGWIANTPNGSTNTIYANGKSTYTTAKDLADAVELVNGYPGVPYEELFRDVYFYTLADIPNAGLEYTINGAQSYVLAAQYTDAEGKGAESYPGWYTVTIPATATGIKVVNVEEKEDGTYDYAGSPGTLYTLTKNDTSDVIICNESQEATIYSTYEALASDVGLKSGYPGKPYVPVYRDVYFYTESTVPNAGLAYTLKGKECFAPAAPLGDNYPNWYKVQVLSETTSVKVVSVAKQEDGTYGYAGYDTAEAQAAATGSDWYPGKNPKTDSLTVYYYNGTTDDTSDAQLTTGWSEVYADVFFYEKGTTNKVMLKTNVPCVQDGDGWWHVDTQLDTQSPFLEDGVYVQFKSSTKMSSFGYWKDDNGEITAAYQLLNNYRCYVTSQMSQHKSAKDAIDALTNTIPENEVPTDSVRVWFYYPGGWNGYYVLGSKAEAGADPASIDTWTEKSSLQEQEAYVSENGGNWYYADLPGNVNYIYFDEDNVFDNGGNYSQAYDISSRTSNEIFCVVDDSVIANGWSTSTAEIVKYYELKNAPASNEISMPVTILDYNADNLFFEYDMWFLRNLSLVLGNDENQYNMDDTGTGENAGGWPIIYEEGNRPGNVPHYDRNGTEYVTDVLENELVNGYPVYTQAAIEYVAKIIYKGFVFYAQDLNQKTVQTYNKSDLFESIYKAISGDTTLAGNADGTTVVTAEKLGTYAASKAKYTAADFDITTYDITKDNELTCMDYAYYVLNNLYNTNSTYNTNYNLYSYLVLKRTSPNVYGFYANYETTKPTSYNLPQNYQIVYQPDAADGAGLIFNNVDSATSLSEEDNTTGAEGYAGFFPYNKTYLDQVFGAGTLTGVDQAKLNENKQEDDDWHHQDEENPELHQVEEYDTYKYYTYTAPDGTEYQDVQYTIDTTAFNPNVEGADRSAQEERNYGYTMKISGKFRFDYDKDLYFTFTGDDDVVMYINGQKVLDLSGGHHAASYTVYLSDLVDDGITPMATGAYYDLDFFYMERHAAWANLRIETNIDVIDVSGQVQKRAYREDGTAIVSGSIIETGTPITYTFELNASASDGLTNLGFTDPSLGVSISPENIDLGTYKDADGNEKARNITELTVQIGDTTYTNLTEDQLKELLKEGIDAGERIIVSGIKYVVNSGITGAVTATMNGATDNRELSSEADHTIYSADPSISVTKTAANGAGINLPNNTVLQAGTVADYTIALKNTGGMPLYNTTLVDPDLGVAFAFGVQVEEDENGDLTIVTDEEGNPVPAVDEEGNPVIVAQLNAYTEPSDLTITVRGTGVADGIYTADTQEELETLIAKLTQVVYPTGATMEISGIKYPIEDTFPSTVTGTGTPLLDYQANSEKGWNAFGNAYKAWVTGGKQGEAPVYTAYVDTELDEGVAEAYAEAYKVYVETIVTDGIAAATVPGLDAFTKTNIVDDDASLTLAAKSTDQSYYTQAGQTIAFTVQSEEVLKANPAPNNTSPSLEAGSVNLTAGSHMVTVYEKHVANEDDASIFVHGIVLKDKEGNIVKELNATPGNYVENGNTSQVYEDGVVRKKSSKCYVIISK